jgi:hypothetical protein
VNPGAEYASADGVMTMELPDLIGRLWRRRNRSDIEANS